MTDIGVTPCDCCGSSGWVPAFSESGISLGRCSNCGLYYIQPMPDQRARMSELEHGRFAGKRRTLDAEAQRRGEEGNKRRFQQIARLAREHAPQGLWLDIGCGAGTLVRVAQDLGIPIEGIELTASRREHVQRTCGIRVYDRPIEDLELPAQRFAVVTLVFVFSHLLSPKRTLRAIHDVLMPGGVLVIYTSEIGPGARRRHYHDWMLGEHIHFLGENTAAHYAQETGFKIVHRESRWAPDDIYSREWLSAPGLSAWRNLAKRFILCTPGALPLLRWYVFSRKHAGNPIYHSYLVLRRKP